MDWASLPETTGITAIGLVVLLYLGLSRGWWYVKPQVTLLLTSIREDRDIRVKEAREDRDIRVTEAREDRDIRLRDAREDRDIRIMELSSERDCLREALEVSQASNVTLLEQLECLIEASKTSHVALASIAREGTK